jgi:hypothetical protein
LFLSLLVPLRFLFIALFVVFYNADKGSFPYTSF